MGIDSRVSVRRVYSGRVVNLDVDTVRFPNGIVGELEMIRHSGASAILPILSEPGADDPELLLLRQYRYAAGRFLFEVPAGRLDPGESPVDCARRELLEETGCTAVALTPLCGFYTTPGFTDEFIHVFLASGLTRGQPGHERDEFISVESLRLSAALDLIGRGEIVDAKTMVTLLLAARVILAR